MGGDPCHYRGAEALPQRTTRTPLPVQLLRQVHCCHKLVNIYTEEDTHTHKHTLNICLDIIIFLRTLFHKVLYITSHHKLLIFNGVVKAVHNLLLSACFCHVGSLMFVFLSCRNQ